MSWSATDRTRHTARCRALRTGRALVPARCTVYEDSAEGMAAARAAGMRVIDVRPFTGPPAAVPS
ncbi:hypothetical protein [Streptomyces puniciscabiei]|uniref:hypothetical protein n=1 Tax=Streptomyces puniciscabiei TaxID=164348 RepID=UPI003EBAC252